MYIKNGRGENIMDKNIKLQLAINKMEGKEGCLAVDIDSIWCKNKDCKDCPYDNPNFSIWKKRD